MIWLTDIFYSEFFTFRTLRVELMLMRNMDITPQSG